MKSRDQQAALAVHRVRDLLVPQHTMLTNAVRGFAAEFGIVARQGPWHVSVPRQQLAKLSPLLQIPKLHRVWIAADR